MGANGSDETLADGYRWGRNGKVINLTADVNFVRFKKTTVEVTFVGRGGEAETIQKNVIGKFFK